MAAITHKILLISIALFLATEAAYSYDDQNGGAAGSYAISYISSTPAAAPSPAVSYISSVPTASPAAAEAPVSTDSYDVTLLAVDVVPTVDSSEPPEPATSGDSSSTGDAWGTMVMNPDTQVQPISYDVPAEKKSAVNMFVQSTMQVTVTKTDNFINGVIDKRLQDPQLDSYSKDCLETCKEVYEDSKSAMKKTLEDIHESNYFKANVDVSAMSSNADSCKECVKKVYGEDPELDKFNKWVDGVIDQCLTMITGYRA